MCPLTGGGGRAMAGLTLRPHLKLSKTREWGLHWALDKVKKCVQSCVFHRGPPLWPVGVLEARQVRGPNSQDPDLASRPSAPTGRSQGDLFKRNVEHKGSKWDEVCRSEACLPSI